MAMARAIVADEARRDRKGRLVVYALPSGDGGGTHEVAGINIRYHPRAFSRIANLIAAGQHGDAEAFVLQYVLNITDAAARWAGNPAVEYVLRDIAYNRGVTGAARILQMALGVPVDGEVGPLTLKALRETDPEKFPRNLRRAREQYERKWAHRDEGSKFWKGLVNRWDRVTERAGAFLFA